MNNKAGPLVLTLPRVALRYVKICCRCQKDHSFSFHLNQEKCILLAIYMANIVITEDDI